MRTLRLVGALALCMFLALGGAAKAALITDGFTFAVASGGGDNSTGTHFHSSTGGDFGNPAGKAEVGRYFTEEVRGLSEFNLAGLAGGPAFVTFNVYSLVGLFPEYLPAFSGTIQVGIYEGNNTEDVSDYQAALVSIVGSFSAAGLAVGDVISFDMTDAFNDALTNGWSSLGIRLQAVPLNESGAMVFDSFRLTSEDETTNRVSEPGTLALFAAGLIAVAHLGRRRRRG